MSIESYTTRYGVGGAEGRGPAVRYDMLDRNSELRGTGTHCSCLKGWGEGGGVVVWEGAIFTVGSKRCHLCTLPHDDGTPLRWRGANDLLPGRRKQEEVEGQGCSISHHPPRPYTHSHP